MFRKIAPHGIQEPYPADDLSVGSIASAEQPIRRVGLRTLERTDLDRICARARCSEFPSSPLNIAFEALSHACLFPTRN